jgi:hypothetical protein
MSCCLLNSCWACRFAWRSGWKGLSTRIVGAGGGGGGGAPPPAKSGAAESPVVDVLLACAGFLESVCVAVPIDCAFAAGGGGWGGGSNGSVVG